MQEKSLEEKKQFLKELKKSYIETLIKELNPSGNVLEVGFGFGYAAEAIQKNNPISHTIIENVPEVAVEAKKWAVNHSNVKVLEDNWRDALPKLGVFESIFYNDYPLENEIDLMQTLSTEDASMIAVRSKELLKMLGDELSQFNVSYSDEEINEFCQKLGSHNFKELYNFFSKLKENGHITPKQFEDVIKKYQLERKESKIKSFDFKVQADALLDFLNECLHNHMQKGSRFTAYLNDRTSKYEDSRFFDEIITNPFLEYKENLIPLKVGDCQGEVLVLTVEKL